MKKEDDVKKEDDNDHPGDRGKSVLVEHGVAMTLPTAGPGDASRVPQNHLENLVAALQELRVVESTFSPHELSDCHADETLHTPDSPPDQAVLDLYRAIDGNFGLDTRSTTAATVNSVFPAARDSVGPASGTPAPALSGPTSPPLQATCATCPWCRNPLAGDLPPPLDPLSTDKWYCVTRGKRVGVFQGWYVPFTSRLGLSNLLTESQGRRPALCLRCQ